MSSLFVFLTLMVLGGGRDAVSESPSRPISLLGPNVAKLNWNTRSLIAADFNGDALMDLAVINNDRAKIDLLVHTLEKNGSQMDSVQLRQNWQPVFSNLPFKKTSVVISVTGFSLAAGDLNGDGQTDMAYTGRPHALTVRYQENGKWERDRIFDLDTPSPWLETLLILDVDHDNRQDLLVLTKSFFLVFRQEADGELQSPHFYPLSDPSLGIFAVDANDDGLPDILYEAPGKEKPLRLRLNQGSGKFGPEHLFNIPAPSTLLRGIPQSSPYSDGFVYVQAESNLLCYMGFTPATENVPFHQVSPRVYGTPNSKGKSSYTFGDFNGDQRLDLAWAGSPSAQVMIYFQNERGSLTVPQIFPGFAEPKSLAASDLDGDGKDELIIASPKEKSLGISHFTSRHRMSYPKPLPGIGQPLAVETADMDGDSVSEIVCLHTQNSERAVSVLHRDSVDENWSVDTQVLEGLKTDPRAIRVLDANQDGLLDLVVFTVQEPLRFLIGTGVGSFTPLSAIGDYQRGLVHNVAPSALTTGDVNGDGKPEILIAQKGYGRALKVDDQGQLEVLDQFNARSSDDRITAVFALDINEKEPKEILLFNPADEELQVLERQNSSVYKYVSSLSLGPLELVTSAVIDLAQNHVPDLFLMGKDRFMWVPLGAQDLALERRGLFETRLQDVWFDDLAVGDLNGDSITDIITVDSSETQIMELWQGQPDDIWTPHLHFKVFEKDPHYRGRQGTDVEPRELITADVTGDQKQDLILLVHDRILVYPQQ